MFPLFKAYEEMFKLGMQTTQMFMSSNEVIQHRTKMMTDAIHGKLPWTDPEFTELWEEKISANIEACTSMANSMAANLFVANSRSIERNIAEGAKALRASTRPYHKKAGANAKRLRNKKT